MDCLDDKLFIFQLRQDHSKSLNNKRSSILTVFIHQNTIPQKDKSLVYFAIMLLFALLFALRYSQRFFHCKQQSANINT